MRTISVDELAQEIRRVDGENSLGAGALAEALMPLLLGPVTPAADWRCEHCDCWSHERVAVQNLVDGKFAPGNYVRCVNCKDVSYFPLRNPPSSEAGERAIADAAKALADMADYYEAQSIDTLSVSEKLRLDGAATRLRNISKALPTIKKPTGKPFDFEAAKHGYVPPSISLRREPTDGK